MIESLTILKEKGHIAEYTDKMLTLNEYQKLGRLTELQAMEEKYSA
jgi:hypothetical protein